MMVAVVALVTIVAMAQAKAPRYIFYFIGDGMGPGHVMATYQYNRLVRGMEEPLLMTSFPIVGQQTTFSASSPVTDSAAAGTALATGTKTLNNMLGMSPDSVALVSIADKLHDAGWGVGIVTTVAADDATPAAFYAHQPSRSLYYEIGVEAARSDFEFIAGSGLRGLVDKQGRRTDLMEQFAQNNVAVVRGANALRGVDSRKIVLLNTDTVMNWQVGYTIDSVGEGLTLPVMTAECLSHLERVSPERFFMMVEGGNIDYGGHANDGATVIKEVIKFDEALREAYDFYLKHPDETLIIVTADHETGGMSVGNNFHHYNCALQYADAQRISKDNFSDLCKAIMKSRRIYTWDDMEELLREKLGFWTSVPVNAEQTKILKESFQRTFVDHTGTEVQALYNRYPEFVNVVFDIMQDFMGIGWTTINHSGNPVGVYAIGVGATEFSRLVDNTDIPRILERLTLGE